MKGVRNEFASEIACHVAGVHATARLATIGVPIQYLVVSRTKASARQVAELMVPVLHNVRCHVLEGMGHMGPVTHPNVFNDKVGDFLLAGR